MEKDILSEVIEAEKKIQKCIELEKAKARTWLERIGKESEEESAAEEKKVEEALNRSREHAKREAGIKAAEILKQAARKTGVMAALSNETLSRIVGRQIKKILPE